MASWAMSASWKSCWARPICSTPRCARLHVAQAVAARCGRSRPAAARPPGRREHLVARVPRRQPPPPHPPPPRPSTGGAATRACRVRRSIAGSAAVCLLRETCPKYRAGAVSRTGAAPCRAAPRRSRSPATWRALREPARAGARPHPADVRRARRAGRRGRSPARPGAPAGAAHRARTSSTRWSPTSARSPPGTSSCSCPGDEQRHVDRWTERYDPDVVVARGADGRWATTERRAGSAHVLHPELALLLSTSGSTGSPKLARLSAEGVQANAEAIAAYLGLREDDRTATTLPMAYCYGLSVLHSHLVAGACVVLTGGVGRRPVLPRAVPRRGRDLAGRRAPHLHPARPRRPARPRPARRATCPRCAGSPAPAAASSRRRSGAGLPPGASAASTCSSCTARPRRRRGWPTCRPSSPSTRPEAVGVPVPGGSIRLDPVEECSGPDRGEIVYRGPNVMLGLRRVARRPRGSAGWSTSCARATWPGAPTTACSRCSGRRSRFAKVLGLRVDLEAVERELAGAARAVACTEADGALVVVAERPSPGLATATARAAGLPSRAVRVERGGAAPPARERQARRRPGPRAGAAGARPASRPAPACARCSPRCSAWTTSRTRRRSSSSAATRCRTSSWPCAWRTSWARCPPTGTSPRSVRWRPSPGRSATAGRPRCAAAGWRRPSCSGPSASCSSSVRTPTCSASSAAPTRCSPSPATTSPASGSPRRRGPSACAAASPRCGASSCRASR